MEQEKALLARARRGEAAAFEMLVAPLESLIYRHCLGMLRNEQDAMDAAQEALLRAYRAMPRFLGASSFTTWLYKIAHNTCLDMIKARKSRVQPSSLDLMGEEGFDPPSAEKPPDEQHDQNETAQQLRKAIAALPDDMRILIEMYHGQELSYEDMAKVLGISIGTVKSRLSRARDKLKRILQNE